MSQQHVRCALMRGGTSKGAYFVADDLPADPHERDDLLLRVMGTPDARQVDGIGGAHPLTSKVAIVGRSADADADVDYLFLQVGVAEAFVSDRQNCGNIIAGVGPFAVERGLVAATGDVTSVRIRMLNTGGIATSTFPTPGGAVDLDGDFAIDGVPGTAAAISLDFAGTAGSSAGSLFPAGSTTTEIEGLAATCVDNGMPSVLLRASDLDVAPDAQVADLEADAALLERLEAIRRAAADAMGLGDVSAATIPKIVLVSAPRAGGAISTRTFLPQSGSGFHVHTSIGVLGALTVGAGAVAPGSVADGLVEMPPAGSPLAVEHPTGAFAVDVALEADRGGFVVTRSAAMRTARMLFDGSVFPRPRR